MLLTSYSKEIFRPECNPSFQSLHCIAHLDQDVTRALPYLNVTLGGFEYLKDPPAVTFRIHGKLITVHPREIAVNALRDEEETATRLHRAMKECPNRRFSKSSSFSLKPTAASADNLRAWCSQHLLRRA
jgi:ArsR family metal-binding transcriptional regulator